MTEVMNRVTRTFVVVALCALATPPLCAADFRDPNADPEALPQVPAGFEVTMYAREPLVHQPCSMAFDARGRLFVGMGPQYRNPTPETPGDRVFMVVDTDGDGRADKTTTFAEGFNAIQGLAWHGRDLWVANSPDLTIVRDLDGDDEADEYRLIYTDLGNLEHGLHGLNWAPDGKLYMSKGNSKGLTQPGRVAPKPFRDLWGVVAPPGTPDFPAPKTFRKGEYHHAFHDPSDDWGLDGGVLRCDDDGRNLEIVSRGFRNPWDIAMDSGFNWLGTDNDQTKGDRIFMTIRGAHFGWNHPWSTHLTDDEHLPTAPTSGPNFEGSGTGVVFGNSPQFPAEYRGVYFMNDWLRKTTFVFRPTWDGALMRPAGGQWEPFIQGNNSLFRPTDIEFGPDGALWILGWGAGYGAEVKDGKVVSEGRVFRVVQKGSSTSPPPRSPKPLEEWPVADLVAEFDSPLPVRRIDAQDELVRREAAIAGEIMTALKQGLPSEARETWAVWTLGRMRKHDPVTTKFLTGALDTASGLNLRIQAVRILGHRARFAEPPEPLPAIVVDQLRSSEPRLRAAAVVAVVESQEKTQVPALLNLLAEETDRVTFYSAWQALRSLADARERRGLLTDSRAGVRLAALLSLLETSSLDRDQVDTLAGDLDPRVREMAELWLKKTSGGNPAPRIKGPSLQKPLEAAAPLRVEAVPPVVHLDVRGKHKYQIVPGGLRPGATIFVDRKYTFKKIPDALLGADFIQSSNQDDGSSGPGFLTFDSPLPIRVSVAFDQRMEQIPAWARAGFTPRDLPIEADHWQYRLVSRDFPAGRVQLGGNTDDGKSGGKSNYTVILEPLPLLRRSEPSGLEETLAVLDQGDAACGEVLFKHAKGGGCSKCHSLDQTRNGFGPNLAGIGRRAAAKHLVQSITDPSAVITEGFTQQLIAMDDGRTFVGVLLEESGLSLTLGLSTGEALTLDKKSIETRASSKVSAMPPLAETLAPRQVADLVAFLQTQQTPLVPTPPQVATANGGLGFQTEPNRVVLTHTGRPIGEFVFKDSQILRPFVANIRLPNRTQVTRSYPPVPGQDATDHSDMHPGLWLGFGDVNGQDFWRNKARIEHVRFVRPPAVEKGQLTFTTEDRLIGADGEPVCRLENDLTAVERGDGWRLTWKATFFADDRDVIFGDQEEMGFGARVATGITEKKGGEIVNSGKGRTAKATWGKPARWCDYSGSIGGIHCGITLMPAPSNFRESWWHNRDYGVFVANPFGRAAMKQGERSQVVVKRGESMTLTFAAAFHGGTSYEPEQEFAAFVESIKAGMAEK